MDYIKNQRYSLLKKRMKYLTSNYTFKKSENGELKAGIFYNYPHLSKDDQSLLELDRFYHKIIFSKNGTIGKDLIPF